MFFHSACPSPPPFPAAPDKLLTTRSRPPSDNARYEEPPQEGEPFDYDAVPARFYYDVESIGQMDPDAIIQNGIKALQQKLAALIHELNATEGGGDADDEYAGANDDYNGGQGFDYNAANGGGGSGADSWQDQGYTTPYAGGGGGGGGGQSAWGGGGGTTPYGTTPYGNPGQSGWN